jgi:methanogenic corrinoid protein MtbC1
MKGDMAQTRSIIHGAYAAGLPLERLADELIAPAMLRMGHQWEEGRIDVMHEHRGTLLCNAALHELRPALETNADQNRPIAVGGNPEGDHSFLASLLIQLMLLDAGWDPVNLGPNTPLASFRIAMSELKPRLLWLSASHLSDPHKFLGEYREIYNDARAAGIAVAVGGQALQNSMPGVLPATCYGGSLTDLAKFARTLYSRPELPKRGRPRQAPAAGGQPGQR